MSHRKNINILFFASVLLGTSIYPASSSQREDGEDLPAAAAAPQAQEEGGFNPAYANALREDLQEEVKTFGERVEREIKTKDLSTLEGLFRDIAILEKKCHDFQQEYGFHFMYSQPVTPTHYWFPLSKASDNLKGIQRHYYDRQSIRRN